MQHEILVPLDGSELAETVLPHAEVLARVTGSGLVLLRVIPLPVLVGAALGGMPGTARPDEVLDAQEAEARAYLAVVAGRLEQAGLKARPVVVEGDPAGIIVAWAAQDAPVRMVAMATHGRSGVRRWAFGSVAEKVLHALPTPLLLVRAQLGTPIPAQLYRTIVVPLDGSPLAEQALGQVLPLAKTTGARLLLVAVAPPLDDGAPVGATELAWVPAVQREAAERLAHYLAEVAERLHSTGIHVETQIIHGHPAEGILHLAAEVQADLIAMSTHGRGGIQRFWLGSVAMKVVQDAHRPVLLMRS